MTEYEQLMASRAALRKELESGGVEDLTLGTPEGVGEDEISKARYMGRDPAAAQLEANAAANANSATLEKSGDAATTAGMAGGNPYVAGAGLALKTVGQVDSAKRGAEQAKIDAYNKKIMAQRSAVRNIFA